MIRPLLLLLGWIGGSLVTSAAITSLGTWVHEVPQSERDFPLVGDNGTVPWVVSADDATVVRIAANDVINDFSRMTGQSAAPVLTGMPEDSPSRLVLAGTLGQHPQIDALVANGTLELGDLPGAWESFVIATVDNPLPDVAQALVIVGSDRRGTAFGIYDLARAAGVSPWQWWADVPPPSRDAIYIAAKTRREGPPDVKYRGLFINDEDWGLQPWAAQTHEPEYGDIGPRTYRRFFELLLRLRANTLWPAMHACTAPFNADPQHARLADDYGIVMSSSHAEPLLRNNVGEWTAPKADYNYVTNPTGVRAYWEDRLLTNGEFENIYSLGMRGIHDSGIQGSLTDAERVALLEKIVADQRDLIAAHVSPAVERVPQQFVAYKEVLDLYRAGLTVPDDVTLVWPDDNFGYVRTFAPADAPQRTGGYGVYYHLSYLGRPMAYLWLSTTSPALIWEEMAKSYAHGADRIWIANVGDLKPAEISTEFFLDLAWDVDRWTPANLPHFLHIWAKREFAGHHSWQIARIMQRYYQLNSRRRPEHLQWWTPLKESPCPSPWSATEIKTHVGAWQELSTEVDTIEARLPEHLLSAFFELVAYPVRGAALAHSRYFSGEMGDAKRAHRADAELKTLTARFDTIADGKWQEFMRLEPADDDWRSMRIAPWQMPDFPPKVPASPAQAIPLNLNPSPDSNWKTIPGLGQSGQAVTIWPFTPNRQANLSVSFSIPESNVAASPDWTLLIHRLPTHPIDPNANQSMTVTLGDGRSFSVDTIIPDGSSAWSQGVLDQRITHALALGALSPGDHVLTLRAGTGLVIDQLSLVPAP